MKKQVFSVFGILAAAVLFSGCVTSYPGKTGKLYVRVLVDGVDVLHVRGNSMWFQHKAYQFPGKYNGADLPVYVGEEQWNPQWNGFVSDVFEFKDTSAAIPSSGVWNADNFTVKCYTTDFGKCKILDYPSEANDYTLTVKIDDYEPDGAHWYVLDFDWAENTETAPAEE